MEREKRKRGRKKRNIGGIKERRKSVVFMSLPGSEETTPKKKKNKKIQDSDSAGCESADVSSSSSTATMAPSTPRTTAREQKSNPPLKKKSLFTVAVPRTEAPPMMIIRTCTADGVCIRIHACESDVSATSGVETNTAEVTAPAGLAAVTKPGISTPPSPA